MEYLPTKCVLGSMLKVNVNWGNYKFYVYIYINVIKLIMFLSYLQSSYSVTQYLLQNGGKGKRMLKL